MAFAISLSNTSYPRVPSAAIHPLWSLRTAASQFGFSRGFAKVSHLPVVFDSSSSAAAASSLSSSSSSPETAAVEERPLEILEHPVAASPWRKMPVITKFLSRLFFGGDDGCEEYCFPGSNLSFAEGFPSSKPKGLSPAGLMCSCAAFTPSSRSFMAAAAAAKEVPVLDFVAAAITLTGALSILQFFDELAKRDLLEKVNWSLHLKSSIRILAFIALPFSSSVTQPKPSLDAFLVTCKVRAFLRRMHAPPKGMLSTPNKVSKDCLVVLCAGNVFSTVFEAENGRGHV